MSPILLGKIRYAVLSLIGVGFFVFFLLSLCSFDPADAPGGPSTLVYPNNHTLRNWCGEAGAGAALWAYEVFGLGVWYVMLSWAFHLTRFLANCHARHPYVRFIGWCATLLGVCAFLGLAFPRALPMIMIGSGGYLGVTVAATLAPLGTVGSMVTCVAILLCGLTLYSDRFVPACVRLGMLCVPRRYAEKMQPAIASIFGQRSVRGDRVEAPEDAELYPLHGLYTGYIDMEAVWAELEMMSGGDAVTDDDEAEKTAAPASLPPKPAPAVPVSEKPEKGKPAGGKKVGVDVPPPRDAGPSVIVDDKNRVITIVRPEDNKNPPMLPEETASPSFQPQVEKEYILPSLDLLQEPEAFDYGSFESEVYSRAELLEDIIGRFGFKVKVEEIQLGPVITQYQISLDAGLRVGKIVNLGDDIAVQLGVANVRIVHPLPGKSNLVGIEIPNIRKQWVYLRQVMEELAGAYEKTSIPMFLGKDVAGKPMMADLAKLPHLLIAGRTGTGKSVCLNSIIISILMTRSPADVKMIMIDPKSGVEMSQYETVPHLMHPVITNPKNAEAVLAWAVDKMEERYTWLSRAKVRHIDMYNKLTDEERLKRVAPQPDEMAKMPSRMPYIVIIVDEMSDLMMSAPREVESHIIRLAQKSRAVGIHLILATQKPTVDVITGLIKSNLPSRIAFQVASKTDSRVVLDENGADRLLGNGDMLFLKPGTSILVRGQGTYVSDEEIQKVIDAISVEKPNYDTDIPSSGGPGGDGDMDAMRERDPVYISAVDVIIREQRGSISLLQRMLGIGYGRAARLIDYMEEDGIVGPFKGYTQPREVFMSVEAWEAKQRISGSGEVVPAVTSPAIPLEEEDVAEEEVPEEFEEEEFEEEEELEEEAPGEDVYGDVSAVVDDLRRRMAQRQENQEEDDNDEDGEDDDEDGEDEDDFYAGMNDPEPPWDDDFSGGQSSRTGSPRDAGQPRTDGKPRKKPKKNRFRKVPKPPRQSRSFEPSAADEAVLSRIEPNQPAPFIRPGKVSEIHDA